MRKTQLATVLIIAAIIASILATFATDNRAAAAITTPSIDTTTNSHKIQRSSSPSTLTVTTSTTQEIIYASFYSKTSGKGLTISSSPALTWNYRGGGNTTGTNGEIAVWWAISSIAQSVTITYTSSGSTGGCIMSAFSVKGADTSSPFDPNLSQAVFGNGYSGTASASITTRNLNDLIVGVVGTNNNKQIYPGTYYTQIDNTGTTTQTGADDYRQVTTAGSNAPSFTFSSSYWVEVADAFVPVSQSITITSSPQTGAGFITVNGTAHSTPYTASYTPGTVLVLSATGTVSGGAGKQYVYSSWSDGGAQTHYYTVQSACEAVIANYQTQNQVTFTQSGLDSSAATGTMLIVNGTSVSYLSLPYSVWVNSGDRLVYTYNSSVSSTNAGKQFILSSVAPASPLVGITTPQTVTANYQAQCRVAFTQSGLDGTTAAGTLLTVNGTAVSYSSLPYYVWVISGDQLVYSYNSTVSSSTSGKQFALDSTSPASPLTGTANPQTVTATYQTQYRITFSVSPSGSGSTDKTTGYYNQGVTSITATPASSYSFNHWSSGGGVTIGSNEAASTTITVNGAGSVTANFALSIQPTSITILGNTSIVDTNPDNNHNQIATNGTLTSQGSGVVGRTVVISYLNGTQWIQIGTAVTGAGGYYEYTWTVTDIVVNGEYLIKSDFAGDNQYLPCSSTSTGNQLHLTVLPEYSWGGLTACVVCFAAMLVFFKRDKLQHKLHQLTASI
jgi:hypothetical protein